MKAVKELNKKILKLTMMIERKYPELSKYIDELWVDVRESNKAELKVKNLSEYYNSLNALFNSYQHQKIDPESKMGIGNFAESGNQNIKFKIEKENKMLLIMESSLGKNKGELIQYNNRLEFNF